MCLWCEYIHQPLWGKLLANGKYVKLHLCWDIKENDWKLWATATVVWHTWYGSGWGSLYIITHRKTRLEKKQRKQTPTTIWAPFIKPALLSQPPKDLVAQLEAREDLSVLPRVLLSLPCVKRQTTLLLFCVSLSPPKPSEWQQTGFVHRRMKKGVPLLTVVLTQHNAGCAQQL